MIQKWEYQLVVEQDYWEYLDKLEKAGAVGWEAVSGQYAITVPAENTYKWVSLMKRPKGE